MFHVKQEDGSVVEIPADVERAAQLAGSEDPVLDYLAERQGKGPAKRAGKAKAEKAVTDAAPASSQEG